MCYVVIYSTSDSDTGMIKADTQYFRHKRAFYDFLILLNQKELLNLEIYEVSESESNLFYF